MFDKVFGWEARQEDVFHATSQPLLKGLFDGYNATVFAYGVSCLLLLLLLAHYSPRGQATGCGKTHTISGTEADPGIIYLTMADLFQRIQDRKDEWNVQVTVTFLEIYNEEIRDLLAEPGSPTPRGGLQIREDKSVKVVGLAELCPATAEEVKAIVLLGNTRRTQSPTKANETSSRSHAVLQVHVMQSPRTASVTEERTMATLSIIDLAGSERAAATSNMGQRMVEGANINKSLLALGNCINALCENGGATRHVPYRNSKLTRLLKFSLGGNCKTVMIVCVAPTSNHFDDTHNTLLYAERATKIKTKVVTRNVVNVDRHVGRYVEAINRLNIEVAELKAKLAGKLGAEGDIVKRKRVEAVKEVERAKSDMQVKADQTQASIVDGARCAGKIGVADVKLRVIRARLEWIDAQASSSLSSDLEAERALLKALAGPEEEALKTESALNQRVRRSYNSGHIFDATLRAVSERRSERLDEVSVDNVKIDARWRKAEMERGKSLAERDALREAVEAQAEMVVNLIGLVGRCNVVLGEAGRLLRSSAEEGKDGMEGLVRALGTRLAGVRERNDEVFAGLVGASTAGCGGDDEKGGMGMMMRVSSAPGAFQQQSEVQQPKGRSRRSSYGGLTYRTPRKSLRSSISQPYRRVSDKKSVQWRDEVGQGDLDDGGQRVDVAPPAISITTVDGTPTSSASSTETRTVSGSESEWEDEKTDDSVSISFSASASLTRSSDTMSMPLGRMNGIGGGAKRPRASRLDPGFLKSKSKASSMLGSLAEDDENTSPVKPAAYQESGKLHVPKGRDRHLGVGSPARRGPTTPRIPGSATKGGRRRLSNMGMSVMRAKRKSSLIPQPSFSPGAGEEDHCAGGGPRRVELMGGSPGKKSRKASLLGTTRNVSAASASSRVKSPMSVATNLANVKAVTGAPTWR